MPTLPLRYEMTLYTGTTFRREFRWLPGGKDADPQDFTGWSGKLRLNGQNMAVQLSSTGHILIKLLPAQTELLQAGTYNYVLDLTDPDGNIIRFLRGRCEVIRDL